MAGVGKPELIVKEGAAYTARLSQEQAERLKKARLVIWMGPELEGFLAKPLASLGGRARVYEILADEVLKVLPARWNPTVRDPFLWLDIRNAEVLVDRLFEALVRVDPAHEAAYVKNRSQLKQLVSLLDRRFEYGFRSVAAGYGWAYHDTQFYFEQAYAFKTKGFLSPRPGEPADLARLLTMKATLGDGKPHCFFSEAGMPTAQVNLLVADSKIRVVELDSFGTKLAPGPDLYKKLMESNFSAIADCFKAVGAVYKPGG
jgi:zinc transport system substrate-binding protein